MKIEIVTHCWRYWRCLTYQASAIFYNPPDRDISLTLNIVATLEDIATCKRIDQLNSLAWPAHVKIVVTYLPKERLLCRGIGRNQVALQSTADVVWFTDCDYLIHGTSLHDIKLLMSSPENSFIFPEKIYGTTHEVGYDLIQDATNWNGPRKISRGHFTEVMKIKRAIGGVQIVSGDLCRKYGYIKDSKEWDKPALKWKRAFEDVRFRKLLVSEGHQAKKVQIADILRIRHPVAGRDDPSVEL